MKTNRGKKVMSVEAKSGEVQKLKSRVRKLEKENEELTSKLNKLENNSKKKKRELTSKLNTAEAVLEKNLKFLKGSTEDVTLEDLMEAAKSDTTLKEIKDNIHCPECGAIEGYKRLVSVVGTIETCLCGYRRKV